MLGPGPQLGASWALAGKKKGFSSQRVEKEGTGRTSHSVRGRDSSCRWGPKSYSLVCAKVLPSPSRGVHQKRPGATAPRQEAKGAWILGRGLRGGAPFGRAEAGASRLWWQLERRLGLSRGCWMRVSGELLGKQRPSIHGQHSNVGHQPLPTPQPPKNPAPFLPHPHIPTNPLNFFPAFQALGPSPSPTSAFQTSLRTLILSTVSSNPPRFCSGRPIPPPPSFANHLVTPSPTPPPLLSLTLWTIRASHLQPRSS